MKENFSTICKQHLLRIWLYFRTFIKWLCMSLIIGAGCGVVGSIFHIGVHEATELRLHHPWILWLLPIAGLLIVGCYKLTRTEGQGTNDIIDEIHNGTGISPLLLPAIFVSTVLTHLCGGSAGREGAALQMGGTIGYNTGKLLHLDEIDLRTATMAGMAAFFTALFGTPLTATVFSIVVVSVGIMYHAAFIPCLAASLTSYGVSIIIGVEPTRFTVSAPELTLPMILRVTVLAVLCALVSVLFCETIHLAEHKLSKWLPNPWIRAAIGGLAIVLLTILVENGRYNGAGMDVVAQAIEGGSAQPEDFLLKILFTAITLSAGFKGGEVVPAFFVGATFGAVVGPLLGIPAGFAGALGLVAVFCGAVNCPIASIFLSVELFGSAGLLYFALSCGISYMLSGYSGLYSSQTIMYSKLKAKYIDIHTNERHADDTEAQGRTMTKP